MKIMKKILSGVMALTMAASMMLTTAVEAGATTASDGMHEFDVKWTEYRVGNYMIGHRLSVGPFDSAEIKELQKEVKDLEYGKNGCVSLWLRLADNDSTTNYQFLFVIDKRFSENVNDYLLFSISKNGMVATSEEYEDVLESVFYEIDGKTYLNLEFSSAKGIAKEIADCEEAKWAIVELDVENNSSKIPLGNNTDLYTFCDFTVEQQEKKDGEFKVIKHITAEENAKNASNNDKTKDISKLTISKISNKSYTGKAVKPAVTVKDGDKKLKKGTDYTVSYKNNTKIGTASVTIKGKGDYTGEKTLSFKIVPAKTTLKVSKKSEKKAVFSWNAVKGAEKYQLYYSVDGGKTYKKYTTISGSKTSYTASKLDFNKYDYKFKLRAYDKVGKTTYYGSYSKIVSVK